MRNKRVDDIGGVEGGRGLRQSFCGSSVRVGPRWRAAGSRHPSVNLTRDCNLNPRSWR